MATDRMIQRIWPAMLLMAVVIFVGFVLLLEIGKF